MMKKMCLLLLLAFSCSAFAQEKVAVYVAGTVDQACKDLISSKVASRISRGKEYVAVERTADFLKVLQKEQDYQVSGEVRDDQIAELGARFGVRYVAVILATGDETYGTIVGKIIDVESGVVTKTIDQSRDIESRADWAAMANNVAYRLFTPKSK